MEDILEYFKGDELAASSWINKYRLNNESMNDFFDRIINEFYKYDGFLKHEKIKNFKYAENLSSYGFTRLNHLDQIKENISNLIKNFKFVIPGGSALAGLGSKQPVSLSNCFVVEQPKDTIEDIFNTCRDTAQIYKRRGGVGIDLSLLRPTEATVNNAAKSSSGVPSWMELYSKVTEVVGQNGRRGALMLSIDINHPDSPDFIQIKQDLSKVTGANVSVKLNNEFLDAMNDDKDYLLKFPCNINTSLDSIFYDSNHNGHRFKEMNYGELYHIKDADGDLSYYKKVKAFDLWSLIIKCAWKTAEPGIFNWDKIINYDPTSVYPELKAVSTNPCQPAWATVLTREGIRQLKDVEEGDEIWSIEGWTKIVNKQSSGIKQVNEYKTSAGSFYGTENHKLISRGEKIEAKYCKEIDIFSGTNTIEEIDSLDVLAGLLIGDGTVHKSNNNLIYLCIGENDKDYLDSPEFKNFKITHRDGLKSYAYTFNVNPLTCAELPLTFERTIPDRYFYGDSKKIKSFLRGLYSANGSVIVSKNSTRVTLKCTSPKLREQVQIMLSSIGIRSYFTTNKPKKVKFNNGEYECRESYDINITTDRKLFQDSIGFIQKYKNDKLQENIGKIRKSNKTHKIFEVINISEEEVFNITVDNSSHTYWTSGLNVSNCGELPLGPYDSCRLIAVNLFSLVFKPFTVEAELNYDLAYNIFYEAQIIANSFVDLELEAIDRILVKINPDYQDLLNYCDKIKSNPEVEFNEWFIRTNLTDEFKLWWKVREIGANGRRTGTGITGYADMLAALNLNYGNKEITDKLFKIKLEAELDASIDLAVLNGAFPLWNTTKEYLKGEIFLEGTNEWYEFIKYNFTSQFNRMIKFGRRNAGISTIAPTGTISLLTQTSSGCEPVFSLYYTRRRKCNSGENPDFIDNNGVGFIEYNVIHPKFKEWYQIWYKNQKAGTVLYNLEKCTKSELDHLISISPWFNNTSAEIDPFLRVQTQAIMQKYITSSISSTVNLPEESVEDNIDTIYRAAFHSGCKGITVYRDGSRSGILIKDTDKKTPLLERPDELECKVLHFKNDDKRYWTAFVGILDGVPYEIFTGIRDLESLPIPPSVTEGKIIKVKEEGKPTRYDFQYVDKQYGYINTLGGLSRVFNKEYWNYARLISALMREGVPTDKLMTILTKLEFETKTLNNWKNGVIRAIKDFIPDGKLTGSNCPECDNELLYEGGCEICKNCGYSKCL